LTAGKKSLFPRILQNAGAIEPIASLVDRKSASIKGKLDIIFISRYVLVVAESFLPLVRTHVLWSAKPSIFCHDRDDEPIAGRFLSLIAGAVVFAPCLSN